MKFTTDDGKEVNTISDDFYSVDKNFEIHKGIWCKPCKHFSTKELAQEYVALNKQKYATTKILS